MKQLLDTNRPWGNSTCLDYFKNHRASVGEAYPSELHFIRKLAPRCQSVLDVGCASGGFCEVFREFNPAILYEGVDVVAGMIEQARSKYPHLIFRQVSGEILPHETGSKDLVFSSGIFHLIRHYSPYLQELYRVSRKFTLVDFRVHMKPTLRTEMCAAFGDAEKREEWNLPYTVLEMGEFLSLLVSLKPVPRRVDIYGYPGRVSANTREDIPGVLFLFAAIEKGEGGDASPEITLSVSDRSRHATV